MSGTVPLTISGAAAGGVHGIVSIPSSLLFGAASTPGSVNNLIQTYLGQVGKAITDSTIAFNNTDLANGQTYTVPGSGPGSVQEFTNIDSAGGTAAGSGSYPNESVAAGTTNVLVQAPGNMTLTGVSSTTNLVVGADSNVDYTVTDPAAGTIYLAGGANSITLNSLFPHNNAESIYSAGNDTINLAGNGTDYVSMYGNGVVEDDAANAYVTAEGNATTNFYWDGGNAGGTLHFTNNSSVAAVIHVGIFVDGSSTVQAPTHVTAFGGAGGGFFVGGTAGSNSLVGGSGAVTLVGGGDNDTLIANSAQLNDFFAGAGNETLLATSTTGTNLFSAGLNYVGLGQPAATGVISTDGSGAQLFFTGNVPGGLTLGGSTQSTAINDYYIVSDATAGGGQYSIYNFTDSASTIFLSNGTASGPGDATISGMGVNQFDPTQYDINLSDGTSIILKGLTSSQIADISTSVNSSGMIYIQG